MYLWQWLVNGEVCSTVLGRLDMKAKERGHLPLRSDDTGQIPAFCWAAWGNENVDLFRVTHYTTRAAERPALSAQFTAAEVVHQELALAA